MPTKSQRHRLIRDLVDGGRIRDQAALQKALRRRRLGVDQSTLSRDLRELGIRKVDGTYRREATGPAEPMPFDYSGVVLDYITCGPHMIVLRATTGQAQPIAVFVDAVRDPAIAATVGGDDTVLIITRSRAQQTVALRRLADWFGDKQS